MNYKEILLKDLTDEQRAAVESSKRRVLVVAGAGSGKTEIMARRVAWWLAVEKIERKSIVAFTFTERAAEELKFRVRRWIAQVTPEGQEVSLGDMYVGTIHGYCLAKLREVWPNEFHNFDVLDEVGRMALISRRFHGVLGLKALQEAQGAGQFATIDSFLRGYDQLHEHDRFDVELPKGTPPYKLGKEEQEWCAQATLRTKVGDSTEAKAFAVSAARYYAFLKCRRFLDFSTSQTEFVRKLRSDNATWRQQVPAGVSLLVDEVQDINPVQKEIIDQLTGTDGRSVAVGDHRQAIYGFRGAKVKIIGDMWTEYRAAKDSSVIDLTANFRSTPRVIELANQWAKTISPVGKMSSADMKSGNMTRKDEDPSHIAMVNFPSRDQEAAWIAKAVRALVPSNSKGARHDKRDGKHRGLALSDVAILARSATDVRTYMKALENDGIDSVVRAGPDLFSQPEVLLAISVIAIAAGVEEFVGSQFNPRSLPNRVRTVLQCDPKPEDVVRAAGTALRSAGLAFSKDAEGRLISAAKDLLARLGGKTFTSAEVSKYRSPAFREYLATQNEIQRVFPQKLFHLLLSEGEVDAWDVGSGRGQTALFHLGCLSGMITGIETPGWTSTSDFKWQVIGLCQYGAEDGRADEQPLLVRPDAVTISTIHAAKGLEFAAVFVADVNPSRFPSGFARRRVTLPLDGSILTEIDVDSLSDNANYDNERRLMYVALTRAERFLMVSHSGNRQSAFARQLRPMISAVGGTATSDSEKVLKDLEYAPKDYRKDLNLNTSFSNLRYYLECPHDFFLRKVLGFAPTIDQAFGYGRGVHNLLREVHSDPKRWAELAKSRPKLEGELNLLIEAGLFYLRYTTGDPAENMRKKGVRVVADYISRYVAELATLQFEPEKSFETMVEYGDGPGGALVTGAIDVIRQDNPPRVTVIDFKSGDPESDNHQKLDPEEMALQVAIYSLAAKKEMEYAPEQGLVRYLDADDPSKSELTVALDGKATASAEKKVRETIRSIRDRDFRKGPTDAKGHRCGQCDFIGFCGMPEALSFKKKSKAGW